MGQEENIIKETKLHNYTERQQQKWEGKTTNEQKEHNRKKEQHKERETEHKTERKTDRKIISKTEVTQANTQIDSAFKCVNPESTTPKDMRHPSKQGSEKHMGTERSKLGYAGVGPPKNLRRQNRRVP